MSQHRNQTIALAALVQACQLVKNLAWKGDADLAQQETLLASLLKIEASNVDEIYQSGDQLHAGLALLTQQLSGLSTDRDTEVTRYSATLLHLERRLNSQPDMLDVISQGIKQTQRQLEHYPLTHENIIARFADIYQQTISTLKPRLLINGEHGFLNQTSNAARIRSLLLAGIRAAVLWRQSGGRRWQFIFSRNRILSDAQRLLSETC